MYRPTLMLVLSLFSLYLTRKCSAQGPNLTPDMLDSTTIVPPSETATDNTTSDPAPPGAPESPTPDPELPFDPTPNFLSPDLVPDATSTDTTPVPSSTDSNSGQLTSDFIATANRDVLQECDTVVISWSSTVHNPSYMLYYSKGTGQIEDTSILSEEVFMGITQGNTKKWRVPLTSESPPGNVSRFQVKEEAGFGRTANLWLSWLEGNRTDCGAFWIGPSDSGQLSALPRTTTTTRWDLGESMTASSMNPGAPNEMTSRSERFDSPTLTPLVAVTQALPTVPAPTPIPTPMSTRIARPIAGSTTINAPNVVGAPNTNNRPSTMVNTPQSSGANSPTNTTESTVQPSVLASTISSQVQNGDGVKPVEGLRMTLVSVGASTTLTVVTEIPLGTAPAWSYSGTSVISDVQPSVGPQVTPVHTRNNNPARGGLPPAAIGAIVGSLLGAIILWILFMVWLKKRKIALGFNEIGDVVFNKSSGETNGIMPFPLPTSEPHSPFNPDSKRRFVQEVPRPVSSVTSIGNTGTRSEFFTMPITESLSEDLYLVASSSDPFKRLSGSHKDRKEDDSKC